MRMKILQVNCVYGVGSTGKITAEIHEGLLEHGIESVVCYGRGKRIEQKNVYKTCGELYSHINHFCAKLRGELYRGCYFSTRKLISIIRNEEPDIVHLQCINGYFVNIPRLVGWLKKKRMKTVLTLHAEFMFTANCGHARECERWKSGCGKCPQLKTDLRSFGIDGTKRSWKKMRGAFSDFQDSLVVTSVSPWLMGRALQSPILGDKKHEVVLNGLNVSTFYPRETKKLREKYPQDTKIVLFSTTCLTDDKNDLKGGHYVIELAKMLKEEKISILVAGDYDKTVKLPDNMIMLGKLKDQNVLAQYYSMADVTVLTSKRETFSMVTAESLCCGTPVVGFKAGGPESIALSEFSEFVPQGDVARLGKVLMRMVNRKWDHPLIAREAKGQYSGERMTSEYIRIYKELMRKENG